MTNHHVVKIPPALYEALAAESPEMLDWVEKRTTRHLFVLFPDRLSFLSVFNQIEALLEDPEWKKSAERIFEIMKVENRRWKNAKHQANWRARRKTEKAGSK